jgi:hypothetical protein
MNNFNDKLKEKAVELFQDGPVQYVWGLWWFRVLQNKDIHDVLIKLLVRCINEESFVIES